MAAAPTSGVPHKNVVLHGGRDTTFVQAAQLCCELVPGWAGVRADDVRVSVISGGITNSLLKVRAHSTLRVVACRAEVCAEH